MTDLFRSARLSYRAVSLDDDLHLFQAIDVDNLGYQNSNSSNISLPSKEDSKTFMKRVSEDFLGAIICLPAPTPSNPGETIPIGQIHLQNSGKNHEHHRHAEIGLDILPSYQGKGYGTEAIRWALEYAFRRAGLHRVRIRAFAWNDGAIKLYERLGFKYEGKEREAFWYNDKWWDGLEFAMLEDEWRELQKEKTSV